MNISQILNGHHWGGYETVDGKQVYEPNSPFGIASLIGLEIDRNKSFYHMTDGLLEYYATPGLFPALWDKLSEWEKEMLSLQIWSGENAESKDYGTIAEKYGITKGKYKYRTGLYAYASRDSAFWLICPCGEVASETRREIIKIIGERMPVQHEKYSPVEGDKMIRRETRMSDFATLVRFAGSNKMTATKDGMLSKPSTRAYLKTVDYDEVPYSIYTKEDAAESIKSMRIASKIYLLSTICGLLSNEKGNLGQGSKAKAILSLPPEQFAKTMFEAYINDQVFSELDYLGLKPGGRKLKIWESRQNFVEVLKKHPVGEWLSVAALGRYLQIGYHNFARKSESYVRIYEKQYASWNSFEEGLIQFMLSSFGALGMLDLYWGPGRQYDTTNTVKGFRITNLGAYALGLTDTYKPPREKIDQPKGGFIVQPDYTVMVPDGKIRQKHESYFERILTKISSDTKISVYRLDFECLVRAMDIGTSLASIRDYLVKNSDKPVPDNILRALDDWEKQSERVKLRQVTILECDDPVLLEEIMHYKGIGALVGDRIGAAVTVTNDTKKLKKLIEKNGRFCLDTI